MKKILLLVILALAGVGAWYYWETRPKPNNELAPLENHILSKHTPAFNASIDSLLSHYYTLSESFVNWDSGSVKQNAVALNEKIQNMHFDEFSKDTAVHQTVLSYKAEISKNLQAIINESDLTARRRTFHTLSQNMYDMLRSVQHDASKVYLQECPMAFNDTETAIWLSKTADIRNPYLGLYHPRYKSGMLECGEVKDSIANK